MPNAWSDIEGVGIHGFVTNPPNKALALIWGSIEHHMSEYWVFKGVLTPFTRF